MKGIAIIIVPLFFLGLCFQTPGPYPLPDIPYFPPPKAAPKNNPTTIEGVELGRHLFYDPVLSKDSSFSCASCHRQSQAFSGSPDLLSLGHDGQKQKRNTPPLFNLAWSSAFFWDGRASSLEEQALIPVREHHEMGLNWKLAATRISRNQNYRKLFRKAFYSETIDSVRITRAIAQFERTLISHNSRYDQVLRKGAKFTQDELEGFELVNDMTKGNCLHCHSSDADGLGSTYEFTNNGLDLTPSDPGLAGISGNKEDVGKFKIPSFRNLVFTSPYMHDGRFKTLEEVLDFYAEGVQHSASLDHRLKAGQHNHPQLTKEEKRKIIVFLKSMSDSSFIQDPRYSSPFIKTSD